MRGRSTPEFLQAYFNRVFDEDGHLLEEACVESIQVLRQILFFAYKLEQPYSEATRQSTVDGFVAVEKEIASLSFDDADPTLDLASRITEGVFAGFDPADIVPKHGPGAVSTGEKLEEKWEFSRLFSKIHQVYPYYRYFVTGGWKELGDRYQWYKGLAREEAGTAKVVLVPKDSRGPRLISCEPLEYQWVQQGLGRKLVEHFEGSSELTMGQINFTNQEVNRQRALVSSADRAYCTLDLKDASDRVSLALVRGVFKHAPRLLKALEACRSNATCLPSGEVLPLSKYAPMGSALCFPVEAYVFWVLLVAAHVLDTRMDIHSVARKVYVYGDDIIVPTAWAERCIATLERYGLRVNFDKCCIQGYFRESCGMDAFRGVCVTPTRIKKPWTGKPSDGTALASYSATMNDLHSKGYYGAADFLLSELQLLYGTLPYVSENAGVPGIVLHSPQMVEFRNRGKAIKRRWNSRYQRVEYWVKYLSEKKVDSTLDSWTRLLRNNVSQAGLEPSRVVIPRSTLIKRGWRAL
jgi:hypothetical protein